KSLLLTQQATPHFGDADQSVVMVLDVASGESRKLTAHKAFQGYASYSPDGLRIAYWYPRDGDPNNVNDIHVTTAAGGDGTVQTRAVDRNLVRAVWMPDGKSLLLGGHDGTRTALWLVPLGGAAKRIDLGEVSPAWGFWIDVSVGKDGAITFAGNTPDRPTELYYLASAAAPPRRLTDLNAEVAARQLGGVETTRIAVSGWSYGGYMTSWLIGHYHVWKAAVAGAAVTNLVDQYNMADFNVLERYGFSSFASPWTGQALQAYRDQSPISYAVFCLKKKNSCRKMNVAPTRSLRCGR